MVTLLRILLLLVKIAIPIVIIYFIYQFIMA